jgi:hypothetical protein
MRTAMLSVALGALLVASARGQGANPAKDRPLDTRYLRDHAATRGFLLGRPVQPKPTPDGKAVLFLRAQARVPRLRLYSSTPPRAGRGSCSPRKWSSTLPPKVLDTP